MRKGMKASFHHVLVETVVAHRLDQIDDVLHLARIDEAQAVHIPAHGITDLLGPPVVVLTEADNAPFELGGGFGHGQGDGMTWVFVHQKARSPTESTLQHEKITDRFKASSVPRVGG